MSSSSVATSTPDTPSISEWCVFWMIATLPPSSPSTNHSSHSGRSRSSRLSCTRVVERDELLPRSRLRQRGVPHVVRDVEAVVVDPDRAGPGRRARASTGGGTAASAAGATARGRARRRCGSGPGRRRTVAAFEDAHGADVHRVLEPLHVQEAGVERSSAGRTCVMRSPMRTRRRSDTVYGAMRTSRDHGLDDLARAGPRARRAPRACRSTATSTARRPGSSTTARSRSSGGCTPSPDTVTPASALALRRVGDGRRRQLTQRRRSRTRCASATRPGRSPSLWDGLECYAAYGDELEPQQLADAWPPTLLGRPPDGIGLVDHESIGDAWEAARRHGLDRRAPARAAHELNATVAAVTRRRARVGVRGGSYQAAGASPSIARNARSSQRCAPASGCGSASRAKKPTALVSSGWPCELAADHAAVEHERVHRDTREAEAQAVEHRDERDRLRTRCRSPRALP